jgi:hypothetical protein
VAPARELLHRDFMPYPPRIELPGHTYHVNTKAVAGCKVFAREEDCLLFLRLLARETTRSDWSCLAYSLMGTHYHLLIRLRSCTLSSGLRHLNSGYARAFNKWHGRRGALWQRRFHDVLIESDAHLLEVTRYIAMNARRAGLCARPEDHPWCSYGASIGRFPTDPLVDQDELLRLFGPRLEDARRRLRTFVEEADPRKRRYQIRV